MTSHEILHKAVDAVGVKAVAHEMKLSPSLIYKWCQPPQAGDEPAAHNPLDRLAHLYRITHDPGPADWLCGVTDAFRVPNSPHRTLTGRDVMEVIQRMLHDFSQVLEAVTSSIQDGSGIDEVESRRIRREWERLKAVAESFVVGCEQGVYNRPQKPKTED